MIAMDEQMQTMSIEERKMLVEPIEMLEDVPLDKSNLEKFTKIGTSMQEKMKQEIVGFLRQSTDIFNWSHEDMLGIDRSCDYSSSKCVPVLQAYPSEEVGVHFELR